jgi:hypothetical protein
MTRFVMRNSVRPLSIEPSAALSVRCSDGRLSTSAGRARDVDVRVHMSAGYAGPPPPEMQQLFASIAGNQQAMDRFVQMNAGTISPAEFFSSPHGAVHESPSPQTESRNVRETGAASTCRMRARGCAAPRSVNRRGATSGVFRSAMPPVSDP